VTPSTTSANSPAADNAQPDTARDGGFWMSTGMRRLTNLGLGLVVLLFAAPRAFRGWPERQPRELLLTLAMILPLLG
jgi:hypothetical protein